MTTGANIYAFGYDSTGLLASITHENGKQTFIQRDANGVAQAIVGPYGQTTQLTNHDANGYVGAVTDPLGHASQIVYSTAADSVGLVTTFTNNRGFASTVTYNPDGTVFKDQDSLGGFKSLTLVDETPTTSDIQLQTALGVSTFYHFEQYDDGGRRDLITWPDATTTISRATKEPDFVRAVSRGSGGEAEKAWGGADGPVPVPRRPRAEPRHQSGEKPVALLGRVSGRGLGDRLGDARRGREFPPCGGAAA
jgi:YD repeat-containing protein